MGLLKGMEAWSGERVFDVPSRPPLAKHVRKWRKGEVGALEGGHDPVAFLQEAVRQELGRTGHRLECSTDGQFRATFWHKGEVRVYMPPQRDYTSMLLAALKSAACIFVGPRLRGGLASRCYSDIEAMKATLEGRLGGRWDF